MESLGMDDRDMGDATGDTASRVRLRAALVDHARLREYLRGAVGSAAVHGRDGQGRSAHPRASTMLGRVWGVLDALFMAGIYFFLYTVIRGRQRRSARFLPVLIAGIFLFSLTTAALGEGGQSIKPAKGLMLELDLPPRVAADRPRSTSACASSCPPRVCSRCLFPCSGGEIGAGIFVFPLLFVLQIVINVGIAMLVATFVTLIPDGTNVMTYVNRVLFFATPVIYPVTLAARLALGLLVGWQPLFPFFASYQADLQRRGARASAW